MSPYYDSNKVLKTAKDITKGVFVDVKFECGGIWVMENDKKAGTTWYAKEIEILPVKVEKTPPATVSSTSYEFDDDDK